MNQIATNFLTRSFASSETIALLLRREDAPRPQQRVVTLEQVLAPRYQAWLTFENDNGANIYVSANPLCHGSRKRTKECIASVRHIYIDIDDDGDARLAALRASNSVPAPTAIVSTSPGKYQALWRVAGFDFEHQEQTLKLIAQAFGGDPACTDRNRVLRVPGFLNQKYSPAHPVVIEYLYGHLAEVMLSQPATNLWLTTKEPNAGEWVSKFIGKVEIERLRETHFDGSRGGRNFSLDRQVEPLVMESEIAGLADLHAYMKYQNYVTRFSFPYFDMPEIAEGFEKRERADDKLPYDPGRVTGSEPDAALKQAPEATPSAQPNTLPFAQQIEPESVITPEMNEPQNIIMRG